MVTPISESAGKPERLIEALREVAREIGFDAIGVTSPASSGLAGERLDSFLELGRHGEMAWMATTAERRRDPRALWPEARSVIACAMSYAPGRDPLEALARPEVGAISCYAQGKDYHVVLKKALKRLAGWLAQRTGAEVKVFVDTAPLMEKPLAAAAGLGWQGKHTNLVSRRHGSWLFLGMILTTAEIDASEPERDHCGRCRRCLDICPTGAFPAPYQLDARRCVSYLTIEHRGHIPLELREGIGNRVFGCDDCLAVCPWNKFAEAAREVRFHARAGLTEPALVALIMLDEADFQERFQGSPVKRAGRAGLVRNALIAAGNSGRRDLLEAVRGRLDDTSPVVRGAAVWALGRIAESTEIGHEAERRMTVEADEEVRAAWRRALAGRAGATPT
ncbi:MAG: tRNA epoxyqueuosine(34) reductase QueG [Rhizobiales bacterium]|nr:tRNA epoxyqueuosine(34) reductase QueG [Hyphomicrobiales bacterium]